VPEVFQSLANHPSSRRPRRIVTVSGRGVRGIFPSLKSAKPAQFESLVEEMALRFLEMCPSVKSIATQPQVFEYSDGASQRRYTPDMEIATPDGTAFLEVKDDRNFTPNSKAAERIRAALPHLRQCGARLQIVLRSDLIANDLQRQLALLLKLRPRCTRYRPDIDATLWDPENGTVPPDEIQLQWEGAKRQCHRLLCQIMKRDPDDLLSVQTR
jgi:hypothetical protein